MSLLRPRVALVCPHTLQVFPSQSMNLVVVTSHIFPQVNKVTYLGLLPLLPRGNKSYYRSVQTSLSVTRCIERVVTWVY